MIYAFYGTDREKIVARGKDIVASAHKKRPDAELVRVDAENFSLGMIPDLLMRQGLFEKKIIALLDMEGVREEEMDACFDVLADFASSANLFIFLFPKLLKARSEKLKKHAEKSEEILAPAKIEKKEESGFGITDAILLRDKQKIWTEFAKVHKNIHVEMLAGTITWQLRAMLLASEPGMTESKSKLSLYVWKKSASGAKKYSREELKDFLLAVTLAYHRGHNGEDMLTELEKILLSI